MSNQAYDNFSADYDRFVNWENRLAVELPFLLEKLKSLSVKDNHSTSVLDAACGTGMHAIALAKEGLQTAGADLSEKMIQRAKENANSAGSETIFKTVGFGDLTDVFDNSILFPFDAIICLGNSLPHLLTIGKLRNTLTDFAACLRLGGMLILQNRNFDKVQEDKNRWFDIQSYKEDQEEGIFLRFYDFDPDGLITFNIIRLHRRDLNEWSQAISSTRLFPLTQNILLNLLVETGFDNISCFGTMGNENFDPQSSNNLVITATRT